MKYRLNPPHFCYCPNQVTSISNAICYGIFSFNGLRWEACGGSFLFILVGRFLTNFVCYCPKLEHRFLSYMLWSFLYSMVSGERYVVVCFAYIALIVDNFGYCPKQWLRLMIFLAFNGFRWEIRCGSFCLYWLDSWQLLSKLSFHNWTLTLALKRQYLKGKTRKSNTI